MQLYILIYASQAAEPVTSLSLEGLADEAARNNAQIKVTGLLLYGSGQYCQLLEGDKEVVKSLFQRISRDERHRVVRLLFEAHSPRRLFPKWHMGRINLEASMDAEDQMIWWDTTHTLEDDHASVASEPPRQALAWVREFMDNHDSRHLGDTI